GSSGPGWGNGKAAAVLFAREGAKVLCSDINEAAARETAAIITKEGGAAEVFACDVSKSDQVAAMAAHCQAAFGARGGGRIDILHNNVGIAVTGGPVDLSEAEWDRVSAVNIKSMFLTCKYVLPVMVAQPPNAAGLRGAIVNISSVAGIRWSGV